MKKLPNYSGKMMVLLAILIVWAVFSAIYIGYTTWTNFKMGQMNQAYQQGRADTVNNLISRANEDCQPFNVNSGNEKVNLINVECLQQQGAAEQGAQGNQGAQSQVEE